MLNRTLTLALLPIAFAALPANAADGPILGHELFGSGPEKVIVFHDWMGDAANYDSVRPWLDTEQFTYAFADVRGYGTSRAIEGEYNSDEIAADTLRLAEHLGWERFHLVGHSMNGLSGFKTILLDWQGDRRIKSYVAVTPVTPDGYPASPDEEAFLAAAMTDDETARNGFSGLTGGRLNDAWSNLKTARHRANTELAAMRGYFQMWLGEDFSQDFKDAMIGTPVHVIGGRNDLHGFQEDYYAKTIAGWLPNVSFTYITDAGHYPMYETPILFATQIEAHMNANK